MFCFIYKLRIEKEIDDNGCVRSNSLLKHLDSCSACRRWFSLFNGLGQKLQDNGQEVPDHVVSEIKAALFLEQLTFRRKPESRRRLLSEPVKYIVAAAAIIMITFGLKLAISPVEKVKTDINDFVLARNNVAQLIPVQIKYSVPDIITLPDDYVETELDLLQSRVLHTVRFIENCLLQDLGQL